MVAALNSTNDPVTVEVVRNKLDGIANEMQLTLLRSSFSPIVKEGLDASASLFTLEGETLAQAVAIPIHLATLIPCIARIVLEFPLASMREGDIFTMNDPYLGGTHLPDFAVVMPIFAEGRPVALSATMTHHQDVGGMSPGSVPTDAVEIYQEGIRIPPIRLMQEGRPNTDLFRILRQNVRIPDTFEGDLNAQIAACRVGARRVAALAEHYGSDRIRGIFGELLDRSEAMTRNALRRLPEGTYRHVGHLDNDGIDLDRHIRIEVAVTIRDGRIRVDLTGSSPQVRGPFNCVPSGSLAAACYAVRAITDAAIPTNGGCFRVIDLVLPPGSVVDPREPAAVNARSATIKRVTGSILAALSEALPDRMPAESACEMLLLAFGGTRPDGSRYVTGEIIAAGSGAAPDKDGVDVIETDATNCMNLPVEAMEMDAPIRIWSTSIRTGSGGPGRMRGGLGIRREYEILHGDVRFTHRGERHFFAARGRNGGEDGEKSRSVIFRNDGRVEEIPSKIVTTLRAGDRILIETAGGGGHGPAQERDPEAIRRDLDDRKTRGE